MLKGLSFAQSFMKAASHLACGTHSDVTQLSIRMSRLCLLSSNTDPKVLKIFVSDHHDKVFPMATWMLSLPLPSFRVVLSSCTIAVATIALRRLCSQHHWSSTRFMSRHIAPTTTEPHSTNAEETCNITDCRMEGKAAEETHGKP